MKTGKHPPWIRVPVLYAGDYPDRFYSGGLSHDGLKYLVSNDGRFCVWGIDQHVILFKDDDDLELDNEGFAWLRESESPR